MNQYYNAQTKTLSSRLDVDPSINCSLDDIKHRLLDAMYPALANHLDVFHDSSHFSHIDIYQGRLTISHSSTRQVMLDGEYSFGNQLFNLDQVNHALTQTYQELFL